MAGERAKDETASNGEDIRGQILSDESMTIPSPTGDNGQQSNSIQGPTETAIDVGTNTECSQLDNIATTIYKTHEELRSMDAQKKQVRYSISMQNLERRKGSFCC